MKNLFILVAFVIFLFSCRSSRQISTVVAKKDSAVVVINPAESDSAKSVRATLAKIKGKQIHFTTFSSKVKVDYSDDKNRRFDFNAFVRMKKDSAIWISIIAALNIEAYRVMITPDSLVILDKINRSIQRKSLAYLQEITKVPFDYRTLEDLIIGNPIYLDKTIVAYADQGERLSLSTVGDAFKHILTVSKSDLSILFSKLDDVDVTRSRTANLSYAEYKLAGTWLFPEVRNISLSEKTRLDVVLDFKQVEFEKLLTFPFSIPKNYKILN
ncbi:MAG: DUF4292 domain-containing protein [Chitinophagia bacterium]|jgi:hypothetical protein